MREQHFIPATPTRRRAVGRQSRCGWSDGLRGGAFHGITPTSSRRRCWGRWRAAVTGDEFAMMERLHRLTGHRGSRGISPVCRAGRCNIGTSSTEQMLDSCAGRGHEVMKGSGL